MAYYDYCDNHGLNWCTVSGFHVQAGVRVLIMCLEREREGGGWVYDLHSSHSAVLSLFSCTCGRRGRSHNANKAMWFQWISCVFEAVFPVWRVFLKYVKREMWNATEYKLEMSHKNAVYLFVCEKENNNWEAEHAGREKTEQREIQNSVGEGGRGGLCSLDTRAPVLPIIHYLSLWSLTSIPTSGNESVPFE